MAMGDNPNVAFHIVRGITRQEFDTGIAILLVKQNARKALSICDKACEVENGMINICGTGKEPLNSEEVKKAYLGA